jgi:hypothetical protein
MVETPFSLQIRSNRAVIASCLLEIVYFRFQCRGFLGQSRVIGQQALDVPWLNILEKKLDLSL